MSTSQPNLLVFDQHKLKDLLAHLVKAGYLFVCPSPETHARVWKRQDERDDKDAQTLEGVFGWNFTVQIAVLYKLLPEQIVQELLDADVLLSSGEDRYRAQIRVSNLYMPRIVQETDKHSDLYYIHSAYPTTPESVFFGPDTYLYLDFISNSKSHLVRPPRAVADVCCGSGAGAIHAARLYPDSKVFGLDLNTQALRMGAMNAASAKTKIQFLESNLFESVKDKSSRPEIDLIVSNPPYIASAPQGTDSLPVYADGGTQEGLELSIRIVEEGKALLAEGGVIMIYTGVAISVDRPATDDFLTFLRQVPDLDLLEYRVIHPDMWSEDIGHGTYSNTGRIQVVGAVLRKSSGTGSNQE